MRKAIITVCAFILPFLLVFSVYRKANDLPYLSFQNVLYSVQGLDYDFNTTVELLNQIKELSSSAFNISSITDINSFFDNVGTFFEMIGKAVMLPFIVIYDLVELLLSIFGIIFKFLGQPFSQ